MAFTWVYLDEAGKPVADLPKEAVIAEFKTKNGRSVYDGGGIEPDVYMDPMKLSKISQALITKYLLFDYANLFASKYSSIPAVRLCKPVCL